MKFKPRRINGKHSTFIECTLCVLLTNKQFMFIQLYRLKIHKILKYN